VVHSSASACATPLKLWYNIPYDGSDAYDLNAAIDPLKDAPKRCTHVPRGSIYITGVHSS